MGVNTNGVLACENAGTCSHGERLAEASEQAEQAGAHMELMQRKNLHVQRVSSVISTDHTPDTYYSSTAKDHLNDAKQTRKVAWLHIPKCGTSFVVTLARYVDASWPDTHKLTDVPKEHEDDVWMKWSTHAAIQQETYDTWRGHFCGMFRSPASRMYSSWVHMAKDPDFRMAPADYADRIRGLVTKMLSGQKNGWACSFNVGNPVGFHAKNNEICDFWTTPNLDLALSRLPGFKFIGLTDEWNLSICLFHAMFGGECLPDEFENGRPGNYTSSERYAHAEVAFKQYHDHFDEAIFAQASRIFWSNVARFKVDESKCRSLCPREPQQAF